MSKKAKPQREPIHVFYDKQLPGGATHCKQSECGYSLYRGVLVQWDEDEDTRLLDLLDTFPANVIEQLLVVQEHEGSVSFLWRDAVPNGYANDDQFDEPNGDTWTVYKSTAIKSLTGD